MEYTFKYKSCKYISCVILPGHAHNTYLIMIHLENCGFLKKSLLSLLITLTLGQKVTKKYLALWEKVWMKL